jgi:hypothetical protein
MSLWHADLTARLALEKITEFLLSLMLEADEINTKQARIITLSQ